MRSVVGYTTHNNRHLMSTITDATIAETTNERVVSIRFSDDLIKLADDAAVRLGLKRADVIRLSIPRGVERLLEQLEPQPERSEA